ncbi:MAG: transketolase [Deltaproteobacteria bacterium]|nr:transketolase [Deltaproteobacteria bacterium]
MSQHLDQLAVNTLRGLSMDAVQKANSGHPGAPMGQAPLGWTIWNRLRRHDPARPEWAGRDRFVLSCGHASMLHYALLHLTGYDLSLDDLKSFRQWGSRTPGHPEFGHTPGVEITTGPLGQGVATSVGMAMAARQLGGRFDRDGHALFDHTIWVIASDGDLMEGISSEAASLAGHLGLGNLVVFWDDNQITIDGRTDISFTEDVSARFAAFGWQTLSVEDGEDLDAIEAAGQAALADPRPSFVRVRTTIGYPAPHKQDTSGVHGSPLGPEELAATKQVMGWPAEPFYVPAELASVKVELMERGAKASSEWDLRHAAYVEAFPEDAAELDRRLEGVLPQGCFDGLPEFPADAKGLATRKASGKVLAALAERLPELVGGSADLAGSNVVKLPGDAMTKGAMGGRNVHWGIREHAMGAAVNGMALHGGVIPFGATFLVFSDYMRPSLRLAALMGLRTRYVYTHDSIGLGEDGPTHQPVEHMAALRAIPGFAAFRPADANETRVCWQAALEWQGPAALALTRQNVPTLDRSVLGSADGALRGGYVLADADDPQVILMATGSEISLALEAREQLASAGVRARVVSLPCFALFEAQDAGYRESVLPNAVRARVAVEAGIRQGWERYVGFDGAYVTLDRFGASAPADVLYEQLGLTSARVVSEAKRVLKG